MITEEKHSPEIMSQLEFLASGVSDDDGIFEFENDAVSLMSASTSVSVMTPEPLLTNRPPAILYLSCNPDFLSPFQCLLRKNVELFEATSVELTHGCKGRKNLALGQVGIRCWHCASRVPLEKRTRGSMYFPRTLQGLYQATQALCQVHLLQACNCIPRVAQEELKRLQSSNDANVMLRDGRATAGKNYWAATAQVMGVFEDQYGLRFTPKLGPPSQEAYEEASQACQTSR